MHVLKEKNRQGWVTVIIGGRWCEAKVYDSPSIYGINNGRISKLCISKIDRWDGMDMLDYNYDRGLDFDTTPPGLLNQVMASLSVL